MIILNKYSEQLLAYAKDYLSLGFKIIPIMEKGKIPILKNWTENPLSTIDEFKEFIKKNENINLGVICGKPSNIVVLDVDLEKDKNGEYTGYDGITSIRLKEAELRSNLPETVTSVTQGSGLQFWFKYPKNVTKITSTIGKLRCVDIRGDGSQVVVAPSIGVKGQYMWLNSPETTELAELPSEWVDFLTKETDKTSVIIKKIRLINLDNDKFELPVKIVNSTRNDTLFKYACSLFAKNETVQSVKEKIYKTNNSLCESPLDESELNIIINSANKYHGKNIEKIEKVIEESQVATANTKKEDAKSYSSWLFQTEKGGVVILEPEFAKWFYESFKKIYFVNGIFRDENGEISDMEVKSIIQEIIAPFIKVKLDSKVNNLLNVLKNFTQFTPAKPMWDVINFENVSLKISANNITEIEKPFTFNKLKNIYYKPQDKCPMWVKYIEDLLNKEDIPLLQEYLGYCLIPTTKAQKSLFIIGDGGEGKSGITTVMQKIMGRSIISGELHEIEDNPFMVANLENKLLFVDDDMDMGSLETTGVFKKLVTMTDSFTVQRKGIQQYQITPYVRFLCLGNGMIRAKYDKSSGFFDRLMFIRVKPIKRRGSNEEDNMLYEKLALESSGIINWAIAGLQRLMRNNFRFSLSENSNKILEDLKEDCENIIKFFKDENAIFFDETYVSTFREINDAYIQWCEDNGFKPLTSRALAIYLKNNAEIFNIKEVRNIKRGNKYMRGYTGISTIPNGAIKLKKDRVII